MNVNKLKGAIMSAGFNQRTLAKALGMSKNTVNAKINGKSRITMDEVDMICEVLSITDIKDKTEIFLS